MHAERRPKDAYARNTDLNYLLPYLTSVLTRRWHCTGCVNFVLGHSNMDSVIRLSTLMYEVVVLVRKRISTECTANSPPPHRQQRWGKKSQ